MLLDNPLDLRKNRKIIQLSNLKVSLKYQSLNIRFALGTLDVVSLHENTVAFAAMMFVRTCKRSENTGKNVREI